MNNTVEFVLLFCHLIKFLKQEKYNKLAIIINIYVAYLYTTRHVLIHARNSGQFSRSIQLASDYFLTCEIQRVHKYDNMMMLAANDQNQ
jgi:hypothetical protein